MKKKTLIFLLTSIIIISCVSISSFAHIRTVIDVYNLQTNRYWNGVLDKITYSWNNSNDHPVYLYYDETMFSEPLYITDPWGFYARGLFHYGNIPKTNYRFSGPIGTIKPVGESFTYTSHYADYSGYIPCDYIPY